MTQEDAETWLRRYRYRRHCDPWSLSIAPCCLMPLRPWIADVAERMQCPPDFPAVGVMVALSSIDRAKGLASDLGGKTTGR